MTIVYTPNKNNNKITTIYIIISIIINITIILVQYLIFIMYIV